MMFRLALDAGHYKYTPGRRVLKEYDPEEHREWWLNQRIASYIEQYAEEYDGLEVLRVDDISGETLIDLEDRTLRANRWGADFYYSIHHNAGIHGGYGGGITAYCAPNSGESASWRNGIYEALIEGTGLRGNRANPKTTANFTVLTATKMPAVLVEHGFMDSPSDIPIILSEEFAKISGKVFVEYLAERVGLRKKVSEGGTIAPKPVLFGIVSTGSSADKTAMWDYLLGELQNEYGVAGLLGNLRVESGLRSDNLQNGYESKLGMSDSEYTNAVDDGVYVNFASDRAGYGLAQWTSEGRKRNLLEYAHGQQISVADYMMQIRFVMKELSEGYNRCLEALKNATSVREASDAVCKLYERPANQSESALQNRARYGEEIYSEFASGSGPMVDPTEETVYVVKKGDTLSAIARRYGMDYRDIADYNGIVNPNRISVGQEIRIPPTIVKDERFEVGEAVRIREGAVWASGKPVPEWVIKKTVYVKQISAYPRIAVSIYRDDSSVTGRIDVRYLYRE